MIDVLSKHARNHLSNFAIKVRGVSRISSAAASVKTFDLFDADGTSRTVGPTDRFYCTGAFGVADTTATAVLEIFIDNNNDGIIDPGEIVAKGAIFNGIPLVREFADPVIGGVGGTPKFTILNPFSEAHVQIDGYIIPAT